MRKENKKYGTIYGELVNYKDIDQEEDSFMYDCWDDTDEELQKLYEVGVKEILFEIDGDPSCNSTMYFETTKKTDFKELMLLIANYRPDEFDGNITFYRNKGYIGVQGDIIDIKPEDLTFGSDYKVNVKCDFCDYTNYIKFHTYTIVSKKLTEPYYCPKCSSNIRAKQTCFKKYNDENYRNGKKQKQTCVEKYGTISYTGTEEYKQKYEETCIKKYGRKSHNSD